MQVTVAFDWTDEEQKKKGLWVEYCLQNDGHSPRQWHRPGGNWVVGLDEALGEKAEPLLIVLTPRMSMTGAVAAAWQAAVAAAARTILPVCFGDVDVPALLAQYVSIQIPEADVGDAAGRTLVAAIDSLGQEESIPRRVSAGFPAVEVDSGDNLPRLRRLTRRSMSEASAVGNRSFAEDRETTGPVLYVRRDIQDHVITHVRREPLTVVSGPAGTGKTSLLWGIASDLLVDAGSDVFFVRAAMLRARGDREPLVTTGHLRHALDAVRRAGNTGFVLIDTADVLMSDDDGYLTLMEIIDTVEEQRATVLVTSRPAEAGVITAGRTAAIELGPYSLHGVDGDVSEYGRAVASHAAAYCQTPGDTSALAEQISGAAVRRQPLGDIARRPLTLRMLFELYAPGLVPGTIDATELFESYWLDRVFRDRRTWSTLMTAERDHDLTGTAMVLAHHMLKEGVPEVVSADIVAPTPKERIRIDEDVARLCARGVGQRDAFGSFSFFHQTFFEFAAAQDLLSRGDFALDVLAARTTQRPKDYFALAVLEQTWISAWRREDAYRSTAARLTSQLLAVTDPPEGKTIPFSLRRCALIVGAQSAVDRPTRAVVEEALAGDRTESAIIRDFLSLLPRPGRPWTDADTGALAVCCRREDSSWHSVIDVLGRVATAEPDHAIAAFEYLSHADLSVPVIGTESLMHRQTRNILSGLMVDRGAKVLALLRDGFARRNADRRTAVLEKVFDLLDTDSDVPGEAVAWADTVCSSQTPTAVMLARLAALHRRAIHAILENAVEDDSRRLLMTFSDQLQTIAESRGGHPPTASVGFCWGFVEAVSSLSTARADSPDGGLVVLALEMLALRHEPRVHEQIHHGWLVGLLKSSSWCRGWAVDRLTEGLPATHRSPATAAQRWADTVRRTLERDDVERAALVAVVTPVADKLHDSGPWFHPDLLLRVLLPAACADAPTAEAALAEIIDGSTELPQDTNRFLVQQAQRLRPADASNRAVLELLTKRAEYEELKQLVAQNPGMLWPADLAATMLAGAMSDIRSVRQTDRRSASGFLRVATGHRVVPTPAWNDMADVLTSSPDPVVRADLFEVAVDAATRGLIKAAPLIEILRFRLDPVVRRGNVGHEHDARAMRRLLVRMLGLHGDREDVGEMLTLAFLSEPETASIAALVGFLIPGGRPSGPTRVDDCIDLVIEVGCRLAAVRTRAPRDVAGAWKGVFGQLLNHADEAALERLIGRLPDMAAPYAVNLVNRLPHRRGSRAPAALSALDSERINTELERSIVFYLDRVGGPDSCWPDLDQDLAQGATWAERAAPS